jgi:hypothetical protein
VAGTGIWVSNEGDNSVTELSASTGNLVRIIRGSNFGFGAPDTITSHGAHIWVVNQGGSVTELSASTGSLVKIFSGAAYGFDEPSGFATAGGRVWVANTNGQSVTEFPVS